MTEPATTSEQALQQLIAITERLSTLLAADAGALEARRPAEVATRAEETARLANTYRHETTRLKADASIAAGAPLKTRQRLIQVTSAFESILARHGRALHAAKTVTEGVVRAIAEEVARVRTSTSGYGPGARQAPAGATAITLNRRA